MKPSSSAPPLGPHEIATAKWGVRKVVQLVIGLLAGVAFLVLRFGTNLAASLGGLGLMAVCVVPALVLYFPLWWAAGIWVERRLQERARQARG